MLYIVAFAYVVLATMLFINPDFEMHNYVVGFLMLVTAVKSCLIQRLAETCDGEHPEDLEE